ncbi:amine sulfotransferase-like [Bufo gargarizans]|uniref:amine sulfotransferase-like n=1 Tax=Bufo gargarizans TaxID=30331 RepID=UPI001CF422B1|nr:amine sulfotransferase-like [Bufo gargarizans]
MHNSKEMDEKVLDDISTTGLFKYKGTYFDTKYTTPEIIDSVEHINVRDDDIFLVTYPKSGTIWTQQIIFLILQESKGNVTDGTDDIAGGLGLEYNVYDVDFESCPSPRLFLSHLPYYLMPKGLKENKGGKVIYVSKNPKDNVVSSYHVQELQESLNDLQMTWGHFFEQFMAGEAPAGLWFDHIRGWYCHKEEFNILFLTYEEMIQDPKSAVLKMCDFLEIKLDNQAVNRIVEKATFKNMKSDLLDKYKLMLNGIVGQSKGSFLHKGTIGDWKNIMTVAQSEKIDKAVKEKLEDLPLKFIWDIDEEMKPFPFLSGDQLQLDIFYLLLTI